MLSNASMTRVVVGSLPLALLSALALAGCYAQSTSTFHHTDKRFHIHENSESVEIFIEQPPAQAYRVVGTIKVRYVRDESQAPLLAAERARLVGCDLITTHLTGAVVGTTQTRPSVVLASWGSSGSGSSGSGGSGGFSSSGGSWGSSSGGGSSGGGTTGTTSNQASTSLYSSHSYYCGIYLTPSQPTTPAVAVTTTATRWM